MVIRLRPEKREEYIRLHADTWPGVLAANHACNIRNFSIYHRDGWLFAYLEHIGLDFAADMARMAEDPEVQRWWCLTDACQEPLPGERKWALMDEVFHQD